MSRLLWRGALRHHRRHPWQAALAVLGVALGVAVVVAIDLATESAREAFRASAETVAGRATHHVVGGPAGVPDEVFVALRREGRLRQAAPLVEAHVTSPALPGRSLRLLGVDPFSEGPLRPHLTRGTGDAATSALITRPGSALLAAEAAADAGLAPGDSLPVEVGGRRRTLRIAGLLEPAGAVEDAGMRDLVVVDVAEAQELLGRTGRLSRIDLVVPGGPPGEETLRSVRDVLPSGLRIEEAGTRVRTFSEMTRAFDLNLSALGLLALLFGVFLIYNTVTFSVVRRRERFGTLRALGVDRREILRLILGEAAVVGVAGGAVGLLLGAALGRGLVRLVTRTINDLYFVVSVEGLTLAPGVLAKGFALGLGATLLAALPPALEATATAPRAALTRSYLEGRARRLVPRAAAAGLALIGAGAALLWLPSSSVGLAFVGLTALLVGIALLTPLATVVAVRALVPGIRRVAGVLGAMAARGVSDAVSRTAPAAAALVVAVAVTVGIGAMISSFRTSVVAWLDTTLRGDVHVSVPGASPGAGGTLTPEDVERLVATEGVSGASRYRRVEVPAPGGAVQVVAVDLDPRSEGGVLLTRGDRAEALGALREGRGVLVSEPFAYRRGVEPGSRIRLDTEVGQRTLPVAGVYRDYGSDRGLVMMSGELYRSLWSDREISSLALFAEEGVSAGRLMRRLEDAAAGGAALRVRSHRDLRARTLEVFDRTFAVTGVLRGAAFVVAFIAVLSALMALQLERGREFGVLRAQGLTPGQVWPLVTARTGLLGAVAGVVALPAGAALAWVLVHVVNRRSFGWTMELHLGPGLALQALALAVGGALLAGLYPAWKMSRTSPAVALREE